MSYTSKNLFGNGYTTYHPTGSKSYTEKTLFAGNSDDRKMDVIKNPKTKDDVFANARAISYNFCLLRSRGIYAEFDTSRYIVNKLIEIGLEEEAEKCKRFLGKINEITREKEKELFSKWRSSRKLSQQ